MSKLNECLTFLRSEHECEFSFYFPKAGHKTWHLLVSDYPIYTSLELAMSLKAIRTKFDKFKFIGVYLKDHNNLRGKIIK